MSATDRLDPSVLNESGAASQELFRSVNERIRELAGTWQGTYDFVCECPDEGCMKTLPLTEAENESLRAQDATFAVLPGHETEGTEIVAGRIREIANEHNVPIVEAPPLARALHKYAEIGEEVPAALYQAVAQVLAYVFQLKRGLRVKAPENIEVPEGMDPLAKGASA